MAINCPECGFSVSGSLVESEYEDHKFCYFCPKCNHEWGYRDLPESNLLDGLDEARELLKASASLLHRASHGPLEVCGRWDDFKIAADRIDQFLDGDNERA